MQVAEPHTMVNLTGLSGTWATDKKTVKRLLEYLRRDGVTIRLAWAIEANPQETGYHAHGWAWGPKIDPDNLGRRCSQVGLGRPHVRRVLHTGNLGYIAKNATYNERSLAAHREVNGQETVHARRFWRDAATGTPFTKVEALRNVDRLRGACDRPAMILARVGAATNEHHADLRNAGGPKR